MKVSGNLTALKGVGPELLKKFKILGIETVEQLIDYYPRRYDDYSHVQSIGQIKPGVVTIKAVIKQARGRYVRRGLHITEAVASDETSSVRLIWFNQPYRAASLKHNQPYFISGEFELSRQHLSIMNPSVELVSDFPVNTARIVPVYRETKGLKSSQIRRLLKELTPSIRRSPESLPKWLLDEQNLISRHEAVESIHFPGSVDDLNRAKHRLGFEEVFELTLAALLNKQEQLANKSLKIDFNETLAKKFVANLPFKLTDAQRRTIWQIYKDLGKPRPMNRLVEGDVGSGKTVVAAMVALMVMEQGLQVAFMAPTELLARQHAGTLFKLLEPMGMSEQIGLLVGSLSTAQKTSAQRRIKNGDIRLVVGTHALIQTKVDMHALGLVVVDEQHRFGVEERKKLLAKAGHAPHLLSMTATPIPRSLALTLYGELDVSIIDSKPAGRLAITTRLVTPSDRLKTYDLVKKTLNTGRQAFVVCPLVSESDVINARSAEKVFNDLSKGPFKDYRVGLLHGKLPAEAKDRVMQAFADHKLDMLITTIVIEVGVDVPNATVMVVENPERFGLAQIHQLRGRIGRSTHQSYCFLMLDSAMSPSPRLKALSANNDGFSLAELDLSLRGPGAIYGTMQHGILDLKVAKLSDMKLISAARSAAQEFIDQGEDLLKYKRLSRRVTNLRAITSLN